MSRRESPLIGLARVGTTGFAQSVRPIPITVTSVTDKRAWEDNLSVLRTSGLESEFGDLQARMWRLERLAGAKRRYLGGLRLKWHTFAHTCMRRSQPQLLEAQKKLLCTSRAQRHLSMAHSHCAFIRLRGATLVIRGSSSLR